MGLIIWIIFGALVGWIASMIAGTNERQGALANIGVGILGAIVGGWIASGVGIGSVTGFNLPSFIIALGGAVLLIWLYKIVFSPGAQKSNHNEK